MLWARISQHIRPALFIRLPTTTKVTKRYLPTSSVIMASNTESTENNVLRKDCEHIFREGVEAVLPHTMIKQHIKVANNCLITDGGKTYNLARNVHVVGFGKAVLGMAHHVDSILKEHIVRGVISVPVGITESYRQNGKEEFLLKTDSRIEMREGSEYNLPDMASYNTTLMIKEIAENLTAEDLLIVLISGGGSALLPAPTAPITLPEFSTVTRLLGQCGASIQELNTVRKNIDDMKGGGLARLAYPAQVLSLILSDVINDPLDLIASAPTVEDTSTANQCLGYFRKHKLLDKIPTSVKDFLDERVMDEMAREKEFIPENEIVTYEHVHNIIVGSISIALQQCSETANKLGYVAYELTRSLRGDVRHVGAMMARLAYYIALVHSHKYHHESANRELVAAEMDLIKHNISKASINDMIKITNQASNLGQSICVICGGETTVNVVGNGKGGRNQELALRVATELHEITKGSSVKKGYEIQFLSAGTDGQDSATDATGAVCDLNTCERAEAQNLDIQQYLNDNDSYNFFAKFDGGASHLKTGITGTNVMDICVLLIRPKAFSIVENSV